MGVFHGSLREAPGPGLGEGCWMPQSSWVRPASLAELGVSQAHCKVGWVAARAQEDCGVERSEHIAHVRGHGAHQGFLLTLGLCTRHGVGLYCVWEQILP